MNDFKLNLYCVKNDAVFQVDCQHQPTRVPGYFLPKTGDVERHHFKSLCPDLYACRLFKPTKT